MRIVWSSSDYLFLDSKPSESLLFQNVLYTVNY